MKPHLFTIILVIAAFISSCQKDNQIPSASKPEVNLQNGTTGATTLATSTVCHTVNDGLIAYYPFHGNANDASGHGHNAYVASYLEYYNSPPYPLPATLTANKYGIANEAYKFNGLTDLIYPIGPVFDPNKVVTQFSFYVRFKSNSQGALIGSGDGWYVAEGWAFNLTVSQDNSSYFTWSESFGEANTQISAIVQSAPVSMGKNCWTDIVVNYSNSILSLYVNGKLAGTTTTAFPSPPHFSSDFAIGFFIYRYPTGFFNSVIDEVRAYNRPLTTAEINYLLAH